MLLEDNTQLIGYVMETFKIRPLNMVTELVAKSGYSISYAYESYVFTEHSHILFEFSEADEQELIVHIHHSVEEDEMNKIFEHLNSCALPLEIKLQAGKIFDVEEKGGNQIELKFYENE
ncbi:MAG: hypothetical protein HQL32_03950 [Planctomycetes bacterium]|nr:hypothetical protein [Planctomycetota bacterium]